MGRVHIVQPVVENSSARFPDDCSCSVAEKFHLMADHFEPPLHCLLPVKISHKKMPKTKMMFAGLTRASSPCTKVAHWLMQRPNDLPLREPAGLFILIQFPPSLIPPHHDMHHYHHHCHRPHDQDMKGDVKSVGVWLVQWVRWVRESVL